MKDLFRSLMSDIESIIDKAAAIEDVKCRKWVLDAGKKPEWYHEASDSEEGKDIKGTMQLNHYIKSYLERLL